MKCNLVKMATLSKTINKIDVERRALYLTLSKLLDDGAMEAVLAFFENNHLISMTQSYPITRREIENALYQYFRDGATVLMREYDVQLLRLVSSQEQVA